jgi:hypothetical protein
MPRSLVSCTCFTFALTITVTVAFTYAGDAVLDARRLSLAANTVSAL